MTETNLMIKAVFWDMDGTLIDSEPYWHEGEMKIAAAHGGYWDEELAWQGSGTPVPDVARRMVEHGCQLSIEETGQGRSITSPKRNSSAFRGSKAWKTCLSRCVTLAFLRCWSPRRRVILRRIWLPKRRLARLRATCAAMMMLRRSRLRPRIWRRVVAWVSLRKI